MDYQRHYDLLIERARSRVLTGYFERHHIIPKCIGGSNDKSNIVNLTAEEHYIAHQLLVKIHPENLGLAAAAVSFCRKNATMHRNNKIYGWLRRSHSKLARQYRHTDEARARIGASSAARVRTPETYAKVSKALKGRPLTLETRAKLSAANSGKKRDPEAVARTAASNRGKKRTPEQCARICTWKGRKHTTESKARISASKKAANLEARTRAAAP